MRISFTIVKDCETKNEFICCRNSFRNRWKISIELHLLGFQTIIISLWKQWKRSSTNLKQISLEVRNWIINCSELQRNETVISEGVNQTQPEGENWWKAFPEPQLSIMTNPTQQTMYWRVYWAAKERTNCLSVRIQFISLEYILGSQTEKWRERRHKSYKKRRKN